MSRIILFTAASACSLAPHLVLGHSGLEYEIRRIDLTQGEQRSESYLKMNPKGRVPVLVEGEFVLTEVPAIMRYITAKAPSAGLWPADPVEEARCAEWLAWISSTVHPAFAHMRRPYRYGDGEEVQANISARGRQTCREYWTEIERKLAGRTFALGERYTVVDAYLMVLWVWGRGALGYDMPGDFPNWTAQARAVTAIPSAKAVFEVEGLALP